MIDKQLSYNYLVCSPKAQSLKASPTPPAWKLDTTDIFAWLKALNGWSLKDSKQIEEKSNFHIMNILAFEKFINMKY